MPAKPVKRKRSKGTKSPEGSPRDWKSFEKLAHFVVSKVDRDATVLVDQKVRDVHTGTLRQCDIVIRRATAGGEVAHLVEVRDHGRPVDVQYVEQVWAKKTSVAAVQARIVSATGFSRAARRKAEALGIEVLTLRQAERSEWGEWIGIETMELTTFHADRKPKVWFVDPNGQPITLDDETARRFATDLDNFWILDAAGEKYMHVRDFLEQTMQFHRDQMLERLPDDGTKKTLTIDVPPGRMEPPMYLAAASGPLQFHGVRTVDTYWKTIEHVPIRVLQYGDDGGPKAEMITAETGGPDAMRFEMLRTMEPEPDGSSKLHVRTRRLKPPE